ncbi:hypothetical protein [Aurantiacibacter odishensis]|uniref:hypothetical protein n=1 Tax=Aurantiacibacter odishensis TaxID=1155476 RepID=UPI000E76E039|nr:hypothetical protein [Aurantiacibacter odishensis]
MTDQFLIFFAVVLVPFPIGFVLAHYRPESRSLKNAALAALPVSLPCFAYALWITFTNDMTCPTKEPCENMAVLWAMAFYVIGVLTAVTGFGVGLLGDAYARNRAKNRSE